MVKSGELMVELQKEEDDAKPRVNLCFYRWTKQRGRDEMGGKRRRREEDGGKRRRRKEDGGKRRRRETKGGKKMAGNAGREYNTGLKNTNHPNPNLT